MTTALTELLSSLVVCLEFRTPGGREIPWCTEHSLSVNLTKKTSPKFDYGCSEKISGSCWTQMGIIDDPTCRVCNEGDDGTRVLSLSNALIYPKIHAGGVLT